MKRQRNPASPRAWLSLALALVVAAHPSVTRSAPAPAPGTLDSSFSDDGIAVTPVSSADQLNGTVVQPDGKIVVAGFAEMGTSGRDFVVLRYTPDGVLDQAFAGDGIVSIAVGPGVSRDEAYGVALQPDGRIVVVGETWETNGTITHAAAARLNVDGTLDSSFGGDGTVVVPLGTKSVLRAVAVQDGGGIVVAGGATELSGGVGLWVAMARLTPSGDLDPTFAGGGKVIRTFGNTSVAHTVALQPDGKIVVAGRTQAGSVSYMLVLRSEANGSTDTTYGNSGNTQTQVDLGSVNVAVSVAFASDGDVVVGGFTNASPGFQFVVARHRSNGSLDPTFDGDGIATNTMGGFGQAFGVAVDDQDRAVAAGDARGVGVIDLGVVRYLPNGALDPSFGGDGTVTADVGGNRNHGRAIALQPDGRIVVAGHSTDGLTDGMNVVRFNGGPASTYRLSVAVQGDGAGKVMSDPSGIDCGTDCSEAYAAGTPVLLTATAGPGSVFAGWSGDCTGTETCAVTLDGDYSVGATFDVDVTPPETTITSAPESPTADATATFEFSASEAGSTFECSVDDAAFTSCVSPLTLAPLSDGAHDFAVRATDVAGNTDESPATAGPGSAFAGWSGDCTGTEPCAVTLDGDYSVGAAFDVDVTAPETTITSAPRSPTADATATFEFAASEAGSTFECSVDDGAFMSCVSPLTLAPLSDGAHDFAVRATDVAGNTDESPATASFVVDTTPPDTTITSGPDAVTTDDTPTFEFASTEPDGSTACALDGAAAQTCASPHTTEALADGNHTFTVRATDAAGNSDPSAASVTFRVCTGPGAGGAAELDEVLRQIDPALADAVLQTTCPPA